MGQVEGTQNSRSHHQRSEPTFVDYYDAPRRKWRSAEVNAEVRAWNQEPSLELVFWDDGGNQRVVTVPRSSPNIQSHGSYTAKQQVDAFTGAGTQIMPNAAVPASSSSSSSSVVVARPARGAAVVSGRAPSHGASVRAVPAQPARTSAAGQKADRGGGSGSGQSGGPKPIFPSVGSSSSSSSSSDSAVSEEEAKELGKLLYLTANANIPDGRVDTCGSIGVGDMLDVKKVGQAHTEWAMAEVKATRRDVRQMPWVLVQMVGGGAESGGASASQEWIPFESDRLAPSGKRAGVMMHPFTAGQMVDALDEFTDKFGNRQKVWRLATVLAVDCTRIKLHFEGWNPRWDIWLDVSTDAGMKRVAKAFRHTGKATDVGTLKKVQDESFRAKLVELGFKIFEMASDGNCLFRSVAHQVFGDVSHHAIVRQQCCDYMASNRDHFEAFADEGSFEGYVASMRSPQTWGGDLEIHAMEELYDHPIAIYSGDAPDPNRPMNFKALAEKEKIHDLRGAERITISYHGKSHYNSILHFNATLPLTRRRTPGALRRARLAGLAPVSVLPKSPSATRGRRESKVDDDFGGAPRIPPPFRNSRSLQEPPSHSATDDDTEVIVTATPSVSQHATPRPSRRVIDDDDDDIVTPVALTRVGSGGMSRLGASLSAAQSPRGSIAPNQLAQTARGSAAPGIGITAGVPAHLHHPPRGRVEPEDHTVAPDSGEDEVLVSATPVAATPVTQQRDDGAREEVDVVAAPVQTRP